ncbi:hypothetical protein ABZY14_30505 [Streptomyces sp. NPDC006617]|uniref:hypothetical protein n=1 Tax=Streptomyces sp. NPDC006617 TaxID=3155354 RepID=UPI0033A06E89
MEHTSAAMEMRPREAPLYRTTGVLPVGAQVRARCDVIETAASSSELIAESELRRDVVYRHNDLIQDFRARVKAQDSTPTAMQELADENRQLKTEIDELGGELRREQARGKTMRMIIAELSLELEQAKAEFEGLAGVTWLPVPR